MSERIDHASEARRWIDEKEAKADREYVPRIEALAFAQAHATLALVEQQRIANLISLMQMQEGIDEKTDMLAGEAMHSIIEYQRTPGTAFSDPDDVPVVRPSIREALGLS